MAATGLASTEENSFSGQRIVLDSAKSFEQVSDAVNACRDQANCWLLMRRVAHARSHQCTGTDTIVWPSGISPANPHCWMTRVPVPLYTMYQLPSDGLQTA